MTGEEYTYLRIGRADGLEVSFGDANTDKCPSKA